MENNDQQKKTTSMPANPKAEDDVQLHIETVTPDTEKDVVPTHQDEEQQSKEVLKPSEETTEAEDEQPVKEEESVIAEGADEEKLPAEGEVNKGNDPGDEIETVSA